jgi:hypothetical protein
VKLAVEIITPFEIAKKVEDLYLGLSSVCEIKQERPESQGQVHFVFLAIHAGTIVPIVLSVIPIAMVGICINYNGNRDF